MNGSTVLPWLFFGPLLGAIGGGLVYQITRWEMAALIAQVCAVLCGGFILVAFISNFIWASKREKAMKASARQNQNSSCPAPPPQNSGPETKE